MNTHSQEMLGTIVPGGIFEENLQKGYNLSQTAVLLRSSALASEYMYPNQSVAAWLVPGFHLLRC